MNSKTLFRAWITIICFVLLCLGISNIASAETVNDLLDTDFGKSFGNGTGYVEIDTSMWAALDMIEQPDGKVLVVGSAANAGENISIHRYNADGSPDTTFSGDGRLLVFIGSSNVRPEAIALQPDGRIVIAGRLWDGSEYDMLAVRLLANGSLDTSFNGTGKLLWDDDTIADSDEQAHDVAILPDGKIAIVGHRDPVCSDCPDKQDAMLWRLSTDGTLDSSFDGDGVAVLDLGDNDEERANALAVQSDGKIVVTGEIRPDSSIDGDLFVARYTTTGQLDASFSADGLVVFDDNNDYFHGEDIALQSNGKIVFGGGHLLGRLNSDGSPDTSFDGDGLIFTRNSTTIPPVVTQLALREDGRIYVAGTAAQGTDVIALLEPDGSLNQAFKQGWFIADGEHTLHLFKELLHLRNGKLLFIGELDSAEFFEGAMHRFHADGSPDVGGRMTVNDNSTDNVAWAVAVGPTDQIYVTGVDDTDTFTLQRFSASGALDVTFAIPSTAVPFSPWDMAVDNNGRIVIAGKHSNESGFHIRRYLSNGSLDLAVSDTLGGFSTTSHALLIQADGKYIVGGVRSSEFTVARFNENGSLDTTFGTNGIATKDFGESYESVTDLAFTTDGKIIAQGQAGDPFLGVHRAVMTRFSADGQPDPTFTDFKLLWSDNSVPFDLAVQPDGKIVSAGQINNRWHVWRHSANGTIDTTFGSVGYTQLFSEAAQGRDVVVQPTGDIISVGCITSGSQDVTVAARLTTTGSLDATFDNDGIAKFIFGTRNECARAMVPIDDAGTDDLIVIGDTEFDGNDDAWMMLRLQGPESAPTAVSVGGVSAEMPIDTILTSQLVVTMLLFSVATAIVYRRQLNVDN